MSKLKQTVLYFATHYTWAFVIIMTITLVSCVFSIHYLSTLESDLKDVYENDVRGGDSIQVAYTALLGIESSMKDLILFPDRKSRERTKAEIKDMVATLKAALNKAYPRFYTPKARQAMQASLDDLKGFLAALDDAQGLTEGKKPMVASDLGKVREKVAVLEKDYDLLLANRSANSNIGISELVSQLRFSLIFTIVIVVVTVVVRFIVYLAGHPARKRARGE